jgi:hypothetical protein
MHEFSDNFLQCADRDPNYTGTVKEHAIRLRATSPWK